MYLTASDLQIPEEVLIRLTDDESTGSVNSGRVDLAASSAQAVVDAALSRQYEVPFGAPPPLVKKLTADIALYNLYLRSGIIPAEVKDSYLQAQDALAKLSDGTLCLSSLMPPSPSFSYNPREFDREKMKGF